MNEILNSYLIGYNWIPVTLWIIRNEKIQMFYYVNRMIIATTQPVVPF